MLPPASALSRASGAPVASTKKLAFHEPRKTAKRFECCSAYFIISDCDVESLLECRDEVHHCYRVEFGQRSEQRTGRIHFPDSISELQSAPNDIFYLIQQHIELREPRRRIQYNIASGAALCNSRPALSNHCGSNGQRIQNEESFPMQVGHVV
jgi:hypothetical protein